jgi:hypothetical protein
MPGFFPLNTCTLLRSVNPEQVLLAQITEQLLLIPLAASSPFPSRAGRCFETLEFTVFIQVVCKLLVPVPGHFVLPLSQKSNSELYSRSAWVMPLSYNRS